MHAQIWGGIEADPRFAAYPFPASKEDSQWDHSP